jgi:hypothetical protein
VLVRKQQKAPQFQVLEEVEDLFCRLELRHPGTVQREAGLEDIPHGLEYVQEKCVLIVRVALHG